MAERNRPDDAAPTEPLLASQSSAPSPGPGPRALAIILFIAFLDLMGFGIMLPQLPFYAIRYHVSAVQVTAIFSIFSICQFIAAPLLGIVSDRHGRRPVLVLSQLGSAIGYALLGVVIQLNLTNVAVALALIYLARIIDGVSGGNISTAQAYISDVTTEENRAKGLGLLGAAFGIGFSCGPLVSVAIGNDTNRAAWPAYAAGAFSLLAMALSWLWLPESRTHRPVAEEIWLHPSRLMPILRRSTLVQLLLISFIAMIAFTMLETILGLFLHDKFTFGPSHTPYGSRELGMYFGYLGVFIVTIQGGMIGRLTKKHGEWPMAILGASAVCLSMGLYVWTGWLPALWLLLVAGAANAIGRSLQQPPIASLISKFSLRSEQGAVFGLYHGLGSLARVLGPLSAGLLYGPIHKTAPFLASGVIMAGVAAWIAALRWSLPAPLPLPVAVTPVVAAQAAMEPT
jgi:DHA1 family tetracycline resistance protein-like MFS transporter